MNSVNVREIQHFSLEEFLLNNDFFIEYTDNSVTKVTRTGEEPVYITRNNNTLFFEADLGSIEEIKSEGLYASILRLNTEILPVSVGINNIDSDDRLVIIESREIGNLDKDEILSVFDAFNIAAKKIEALLQNFLN